MRKLIQPFFLFTNVESKHLTVLHVLRALAYMYFKNANNFEKQYTVKTALVKIRIICLYKEITIPPGIKVI